MPAHALAGTYFYLPAAVADGGTVYVFWFKNTDTGEGTDPMIPGTTSVEVDFHSNDTATAIAVVTTAAIDALPEFSATSVGDLITVTNTTPGSSVIGHDFDTQFTFTDLITGTISLRDKSTNFGLARD